MRNLIIIVICLMAYTAVAQDDPVWDYENKVNLQSKGKNELTRIYLDQLEPLMYNAALMPLFDTTMNVPDNKMTRKQLNNVTRSTVWHVDELRYNLDGLLAYADKEALVEAIIQLQQINKIISNFKFQTKSNPVK